MMKAPHLFLLQHSILFLLCMWDGFWYHNGLFSSTIWPSEKGKKKGEVDFSNVFLHTHKHQVIFSSFSCTLVRKKWTISVQIWQDVQILWTENSKWIFETTHLQNLQGANKNLGVKFVVPMYTRVCWTRHA